MTTKDNLFQEQERNKDFEVRSLDTLTNKSTEKAIPFWHHLKYVLVGILFGIILIKSEVISWFRIQEMFRLQSFHMYGVIGSAVVTGMISVFILKKFKVKTWSGEPIKFSNKQTGKGQIYGGLMFGLGWALTGACPGPLYAQVGMGATVVLVMIASAIAGTWVYGLVQEKLP
jgi:hypothetical protein